MKSTINPEGAFLVVVAFFMLAASVAAQQTQVFFDQTTFEQATGAVDASIPPATDFTPFPGFTGVGCTDLITTTAGNINIMITAPDTLPTLGFQHGICIVEADANPYSPSFPQPQVARTIVGNGKDNFEFQLSSTIQAIGFEIVTNFTAQETITLRDSSGNIIDTHTFISSPGVPEARRYPLPRAHGRGPRSPTPYVDGSLARAGRIRQDRED